MVSHLLFQGGGGGLSLWSMAAAEDPAYLSVVVCFAAFLAGDVQTSVMAHYAPGLFSTKQKLHSRHPAPDEDTAAVLELVEWREDAPYG